MYSYRYEKALHSRSVLCIHWEYLEFEKDHTFSSHMKENVFGKIQLVPVIVQSLQKHFYTKGLAQIK